MQEKTWLFMNIRSEVFCLLNNIIRQVETKPWNRKQILVRYDRQIICMYNTFKTCFKN